MTFYYSFIEVDKDLIKTLVTDINNNNCKENEDFHITLFYDAKNSNPFYENIKEDTEFEFLITGYIHKDDALALIVECDFKDKEFYKDFYHITVRYPIKKRPVYSNFLPKLVEQNKATKVLFEVPIKTKGLYKKKYKDIPVVNVL